MTRAVAAIIAAITLLLSTSASAREPREEEGSPFPPPITPAPDPAPLVVPDGLYYVTDTYVADVVAVTGPTTTYSTTTAHESTGTYARVIDTVDTGAMSSFDGTAFNGRGTLSDGRGLAGTYYENFVLTANGYVPVSIVFFQDDSETRRAAAAPSPNPWATPLTVAPRATIDPVATRPTAAPAPAPTTSSRPGRTSPPTRPTLRAGIALASDGPILATAELLRGRTVQFWPRAFANDLAVPIRSWRLLSAQPDHISATTGSTGPLSAQWLRMPAPEGRWSLRFEIFTEVAPAERLEAQISITVRSPALID